MATQLQKPKKTGTDTVKLIHTIEDVLNTSNLLLLIPTLGITSYFTIDKQYQSFIHLLLAVCFVLVVGVKAKKRLQKRFHKFHHLFGIISMVTSQKLDRILITDDTIKSLDEDIICSYRPAESSKDKHLASDLVADANDKVSPIYYANHLKNITTVHKNGSYLIFNKNGNVIAAFTILPTLNGRHLNSPDLFPSISCLAPGKSHTILLHDLVFNINNLGMTEISYTLALLCQKIAEIACTDDDSYQDILIYAKARQDDYVFNQTLIRMGFEEVVNENHPENIITYKLDFAHHWYNPIILKIYELIRN